MKTVFTSPRVIANSFFAAALVFSSLSWCEAAVPSGTDKTFYVRANSTSTLAPADWGFYDADSPPDSFSAVKITTLPATGILLADGLNVAAGQSISLRPGPAGLGWTPQASSNGEWTAITSSADGIKLAAVSGGRIYTSTNAGMSWTVQWALSGGAWSSIVSSFDGTKLAAAVYGGQIYTSSDSGVTWTPRELGRWWTSITSSVDGSKLVAVVSGGQIHTSTDSGVNWIARESNRAWSCVTSSADGSKLAAVVNSNGQIYTSTDSGVTWTARESNRNWKSIASSTDGQKLAACVQSGQIYTSTDSGMTWTSRESNRSWSQITSSADGSKLASVVYGGQIYTSADSGATWSPRESNRLWRSITSSADGSKLAAGNNSQIFISEGAVPTLTYTAPSGTGSSSLTFQVQDSAPAENQDISPNELNFFFSSHSPPAGTDRSSLVLSASTTTLTKADWGFSDSNLPADTFSAVRITSLPTNGTLSVDGLNAIAGQTVSVLPGPAGAVWTANSAGSRKWSCITSSADGTKLAAVVAGGQIHTSNDSGATWTPRESNREWLSITSSSDGNKLAAVVWRDGQIYTSTDSGVSWTPRASNRYWRSIASSADGSKLAAAVENGQIFTSTNFGVSWTPREANRNWYSITSSDDGSKLAAVVFNGYIHTSTDSGVTWTQQTSSGIRNWSSITSSADGSKLAAVVIGGQIYTSTNSGATWTPRELSRNWSCITASADGSKLVALAYGGQIHTSSDSGVTWTPRESARDWRYITSSANGGRLTAVVNDGEAYSSVGGLPAISYTAPSSMGSASFTFQVQDSGTTENLDLSPNTLTFNYGTANPTPTFPSTPLGGWQLNPTTGLFDIDVPVQNTTASVINGFRLSVDLSAYAASHPTLILSNFSSPSGTTPAYVDYDYPLAVGQTVMKRLSFSVTPSVMPDPFSPMISVTTLSPSTVGGPLPNGLNFSGAAAQPNNGGPFLMNWQSTPGRWYRIYYTNDLQQWFPASTPIQANSSQTQWSDTGPPHTNAPAASARFYKVSEIAAP